MASFEELIQVQSKSTILSTLLGFLSLKGYPVSSWVTGMVSKDLSEFVAAFLSDLTNRVVQIAKGGYLDYAEGDWLTVLARSFYALDRAPAVAAQHYLTLTNATGGTINVTVGSLFQTVGGVQFSVPATSIGSGLSVVATATAVTPAASGNVALNTITQSVSSYPGLTATNAPDAFTGSSLITTGSDEESNELLRSRCKAKWSSIGAGGNADAWRYWALNAVPGVVTKVKIFPAVPGGMQVTYVVANDTGPISLTDFLTVVDYVATRCPLTITPNALNASTSTTKPTGTVYYKNTTSLANAQSDVAASLLALQKRKDIGDPLFFAELIEAIMSPASITNVTLSSPTSDVGISSTSMHTFDLSALSWAATPYGI